MDSFRPRSWGKFQNKKPRVLLLTSQYFLMGEVVAAFERLEIPHVFLDLNTNEMAIQDFVNSVLGAVTNFLPDFVLTVNHLGVDREGVLLQILEQMDIPLASWFVDNPFLILPVYPTRHADSTVIFSWDADNLEPLQEFGYEHVKYLPLAADPHRFESLGATGKKEWESDVSFVGNSMLTKVAKRLEAANPGPMLRSKYKEIAAAFGPSEAKSAAKFLMYNFPDYTDDFHALSTPQRKLAFETLLTWQSTLDYRLTCVKQLMDFGPLIVGDEGWKQLLAEYPGQWRYHKEVNYYKDLPSLYPLSKVNFNCTSLQMKGAVNQRVFDVPAAGAFLLTDDRRQMEDMFEPGKEIVVYKDPEEIPGLVEKYLKDENARKRIIKAAQKRILAEHTYDHRITSIIDKMRLIFG